MPLVRRSVDEPVSQESHQTAQTAAEQQVEPTAQTAAAEQQFEPTAQTAAAEQQFEPNVATSAEPAAEEVADAPPFQVNESQLKEDLEGEAARAEAEQKEAAARAEAEQKAQAALEGASASNSLSSTSTVGSPGTSVVVKGQAQQSMAALQQQGYEGLSVGFGSFPIVKLENEGFFKDTDEVIYGNWLTGRVLASKAKFVYKNTNCPEKDEEAVYSYDGKVEANNSVPLEEIFREWKSRGWGVEKKEYLEATCLLEETEKLGDAKKGSLCLLSIPPTSKSRLSGFFMQNGLMHSGAMPSEYITKFSVGDKVTKAIKPFYPWRFEYMGDGTLEA